MSSSQSNTHRPVFGNAKGGAFSPSKPSTVRKLSTRELYEVRQRTARLQLAEEDARSDLSSAAFFAFDCIVRLLLVARFELITEVRQRILLEEEEQVDRDDVRKARQTLSDRVVAQARQEDRNVMAKAALLNVAKTDIDPLIAGTKRMLQNSARHAMTAQLEQKKSELQQMETKRIAAEIELRTKAAVDMELLSSSIARLNGQIELERDNPRVVARLTAERTAIGKELDKLLAVDAKRIEREQHEQQRAARMKQLKMKVSEAGKANIIVKTMEAELARFVEEEDKAIAENMRRLVLGTCSASAFLGSTRVQQTTSPNFEDVTSERGSITSGHGTQVVAVPAAYKMTGLVSPVCDPYPLSSKGCQNSSQSPSVGNSSTVLDERSSKSSSASPPSRISRMGAKTALVPAKASSPSSPLTSSRSRQQQVILSQAAPKT